MLHTRAIGVVAAYVVGSVLVLWPLPAHLFDAVWGANPATWSLLWAFDQPEAFSAAKAGTEPTVAAGAAVLGVGQTLRHAGVPLPAVLNGLLLLGICAAGVTAHALGRTLSGSDLGGFLAGSTFMTSPLLAAHAANGQTDPIVAWLLPGIAYVTVSVLRNPEIRGYALLATLLGAVGWGATALLQPSVATVTLLVAWRTFDTRRRPATGLLVLVVVAVAFAVAMPATFTTSLVEPSEFGTDVHPGVTNRWALGHLALVVAVLGAAAAGHKGLPWFALALFGTAFSVFDDFAPVNLAGSYAYLALLAAAALGASGYAVLAQSTPAAAVSGAAALVVFAVGQGAFALPWTTRNTVHPAIATVEAPDFSGLPPREWLDVPHQSASTTLSGARARFRQTLHHQPLFAARLGGDSAGTLRENGALNLLLGDAGRGAITGFVSADLQALIEAKLGYVAVRTLVPCDEVVFSRGQLSPQLALEPIFSGLKAAFDPPVQTGGGTVVYALPTGSVAKVQPAFTTQRLASALDFATFQLPVVLEKDGSLPLFVGSARQFSLWLAADKPGTVVIRIRANGSSRLVPLALVENRWAWHAIPLNETADVTITAEAGETRTTFRFTGTQVML